MIKPWNINTDMAMENPVCIKIRVALWFSTFRVPPVNAHQRNHNGLKRNDHGCHHLSLLLCRATELVHFPSELVPLTIVRMFSSSAATGLALDIFKEYGTDSYLGRVASILMSCTETIFYTMSVYFMTARVKKTRHTLAGALLATAGGIAASIVLAGMM